MPQTRTITTYSFDELSDAAKERARDWYRETCSHDDFDTEYFYDDFERIATILGVDFDTRSVPLMSGKTRQEPDISWSGFCSQGDGLSFTGSYKYQTGAPVSIRAHAPQDKDLHSIADRLAEIQQRNWFGLQATITRTSSNYYHENTVDIEVVDARNLDRDVGDAVHIAECMRDFMRWMYAQLDAENDYRYSAEYVDEQITCNEYEFDEDGSIA